MLGYAIALVTAIYMVFFSDKPHILYSSIINKTIAVLIVFAAGLAAYRVGGWLRRGMTSDVVTSDQGCLVALPLMVVWKLALNLVLCVFAAFVVTTFYFASFGVSGAKLGDRIMAGNIAKSYYLVEGWKSAHKQEVAQWEREYPIAYGPNFAKSVLASKEPADVSKADRVFTPDQRERMLQAKLYWEVNKATEVTSLNKEAAYAIRPVFDRLVARLKLENICFTDYDSEHREWYRCDG